MENSNLDEHDIHEKLSFLGRPVTQRPYQEVPKMSQARDHQQSTNSQLTAQEKEEAELDSVYFRGSRNQAAEDIPFEDQY